MGIDRPARSVAWIIAASSFAFAVIQLDVTIVNALLTRLGSRSTFFDMLPGFVLIPAGIGLAVPAMTTAILSSVDRARSGVASAVLNAARQVGGAIGVAAFGALVSGITAEQITSGLKIAALTAAALLIIATFIALSVRSERDARE